MVFGFNGSRVAPATTPGQTAGGSGITLGDVTASEANMKVDQGEWDVEKRPVDRYVGQRDGVIATKKDNSPPCYGFAPLALVLTVLALVAGSFAAGVHTGKGMSAGESSDNAAAFNVTADLTNAPTTTAPTGTVSQGSTTPAPTVTPSRSPTDAQASTGPTSAPTRKPLSEGSTSAVPTVSPTRSPTEEHASTGPTASSSLSPSSSAPTAIPTLAPTFTPSTAMPTSMPCTFRYYRFFHTRVHDKNSHRNYFCIYDMTFNRGNKNLQPTKVIEYHPNKVERNSAYPDLTSEDVVTDDDDMTHWCNYWGGFGYNSGRITWDFTTPVRIPEYSILAKATVDFPSVWKLQARNDPTAAWVTISDVEEGRDFSMEGIPLGLARVKFATICA